MLSGCFLNFLLLYVFFSYGLKQLYQTPQNEMLKPIVSGKQGIRSRVDLLVYFILAV